MEIAAKHFRKRDAILSCLQHTDSHPSAETLYAMLHRDHPDISLATVYRNLALFKSQGLIMSLGTVNGTERFDGNTTPHVHYLCSCCGAVADLHGIQVPASLIDSARRDSGGSVDTCQLVFSGICGECLKNEEN